MTRTGRKYKMDLDAEHPVVQTAAYSSAKAVLTILKFGGFVNFSEQSGISHETSAALLYKHQSRKSCKSYFARALETIMSRYQELRAVMTKEERKFVERWVNDWAKTVAEDQLAARKKRKESKRPGGIPKKERELMDRYRAKVKADINKLVDDWTHVFKEPITVEIEREFDPDRAEHKKWPSPHPKQNSGEQASPEPTPPPSSDSTPSQP